MVHSNQNLGSITCLMQAMRKNQIIMLKEEMNVYQRKYHKSNSGWISIQIIHNINEKKMTMAEISVIDDER